MKGDKISKQNCCGPTAYILPFFMCWSQNYFEMKDYLIGCLKEGLGANQFWIYGHFGAKSLALSEGCLAHFVLNSEKIPWCIGKLIGQLNLKTAG